MLTPLLCHRNISWWQWYYASSHLLQGGPYCRVGPTAGWALLQSGKWCPKISSFPGPSSHKNSIQNTSYYDPKLKFISSPWKVAKGHMIRTLVFNKWGLLTNCSKKKKKKDISRVIGKSSKAFCLIFFGGEFHTFPNFLWWWILRTLFFSLWDLYRGVMVLFGTGLGRKVLVHF